MASIIEFDKIHVKDFDNNKIIELFDNLYSNTRKFIYQNKDIIDKYFYDLFSYFNKVYDKVKNNMWLNNTMSEEFYNKYDLVTFDEVEYSRLTFQLEYIRLVDTSRIDVLKMDDEYIRLLFNSLIEFDDINIKTYQRVVHGLSNAIIKEIIDKIDNKRKKYMMMDIISMLIDGHTYLDIKIECNGMYMDTEENSDYNLDAGIITIDKIHDYYIDQAIIMKELCNSNSFNNIDKILLIKGYNNSIQLKFIELIKVIRKCKKNLMDELDCISDLVEIFLYYKDQINNIDIEDLETILFYKNINKLNIEETNDMYNDYHKKGM